jgi:hypothetical protein
LILRGKWCSDTCQYDRRRPPVGERIGPGHPTSIVVDFLVRGYEVEQIAARAHSSVAEVERVLAAHHVNRRRLERCRDFVPHRLLSVLTRLGAF